MSRPIRTLALLLAGSLAGSIVFAASPPDLRNPLDEKSGPTLRQACEQRLFDCLYSAGEKQQELHRQVEIYREAITRHGRNHLPNSLTRLHLAITHHLDQLSFPTPIESIEDSRASLRCDWKGTPNKCQHEWRTIQQNARRRLTEAQEVLQASGAS